jgi:hypothetical protein
MWLHCHKHGTCYSILSCSPLILIGAHFSSLAINQLHDLSLFKKMTKKQPCSEINAFKNLDPGSVIVCKVKIYENIFHLAFSALVLVKMLLICGIFLINSAHPLAVDILEELLLRKVRVIMW